MISISFIEVISTGLVGGVITLKELHADEAFLSRVFLAQFGLMGLREQNYFGETKST
jgi:hypothetical protein